MSLKPSDFFIGIVDLLGVLLPGVVLAVWLTPVVASLPVLPSLTGMPSGLDVRTLVFIAGVLFLGHLAYGLGGALEDCWHRVTRRRRERTALRDYVVEAAEVLRRLGHREWRGRPSKRYCMILLQRESQGAAVEVARLYALSRFFRSFLAVFALILLLEVVAGALPANEGAIVWRGVAATLFAAFCIGSFVGYRVYRGKHEKMLYWSIIALLGPKVRTEEGSRAPVVGGVL